MVLGAGIERLRDDHGADDHAEQGAGKQRRAGSRSEQPERAAALSEFIRGQDFGVADLAADRLHDRVAVGIRLEPYQLSLARSPGVPVKPRAFFASTKT